MKRRHIRGPAVVPRPRGAVCARCSHDDWDGRRRCRECARRYKRDWDRRHYVRGVGKVPALREDDEYADLQERLDAALDGAA